MTAPDLKPCPFCGGKPYLANVAMAGCAYVVCTDCRLQTDDGSQERVTAAWNTRATDPRIETLERERDDARAYAAEVRMREKRAEDARISAEARLDATKDKAEAAILDLMAERDRAEARLAKAVKALRLAVAELEDADASNMAIALLHATLAEMGDATDE